MHFYKAKWEASTPTRVQINVPTNTDYMIGTELYVKGEKKEITAENVTLSDGSIILTDTNAVAPSGQTDYWTSATAGNFNTFTFKGNAQNARLYSNVKLKDVDGVQYAYAQDIDDLQITTTAGSVLKNGNSAINAASIAIDGITYTIQLAAKSRIVDGKDGVLYYVINSPSGVVDYIDIPEGAVITSTRYYDAGTDAYVNRVGTFSMRFRYPVVYTADTTVNGIPAFTMKSLDAEADKLYDVEFKSEIETHTALSATNDDFTASISTLNTWTAKKLFKIVPTLKYNQTKNKLEIVDGSKMTATAAATGKDYFTDVHPAVVINNFFTITTPDNTTYSINYVPYNNQDIDGTGTPGESYYTIASNGSFLDEVEIPVGSVFTSMSSKGTPVFNAFSFSLGEAYDYKFKLFVNEDEQSYGDVQVGQEFPNTITLSGTYEDDTTFSYTIPVVEG